jgi:glycosyltransferase involved in cell wall biosynthesis
MSVVAIPPKVSVTVVTYNHGEWLRECLDSIITQQTDFSFEVIVGDDCSTDGVTRKILSEYASRHPNIIVPVLRNGNVGVTANWLDVIRRARGEYIAHIDGDDRMLPGKLQKQSDFLDKHLDCSMVVHDLRIFDGKTGAILSETFTNLSIPEKTDINFLVLNRCYFGHSSKMFRRSSIISQIRDKPTIDFFMHIEQASKWNVGYINEVLGEYRKSSGTATDVSAPFYKKLIIGHHDAFDRALELGVDPWVVAKGRLLYNYSVAYRALLSNDLGGFKKFIQLEQADSQYASWKHRLFYALRFYPRLVLMLIKVKDIIYRIVSGVKKFTK